ncbi:ABC transporter ATP-binding protein [Peribacillus sp. NJ11]|uniref:ABC transporter ATP-binding protein n=1 Tax=Peribacillus sp. NJ11 TaxID=3055861 RepID=UPI0025A1F5E2|nr:ABC transporter ATP-binding protein [Peribacillus sp. NJ11]MDM5220319.1 ABC transporter ATP-binding protein [Peribacillus sp. NJ11]
MYAFETNQITKKYGDHTVVNKVDLNVTQGHIFGFLGKNGAGKSTFINMVTGITTPTSGDFKILGSSEITEDKIKRRIGVLPDYSTFYDDLTGIEHLKFLGNVLGVRRSKAELIALLERVELGDAIKTKTKKYSFGMKKKLGVAQALINDPDLIFLDEPTSGVDANAVLNIHSLIKNVAAEGKTIFLTSHNLNEVEKLCDEIAIMDKGIIQAQGSMEQLRHKYQSQLTVKVKHGKIPIEHKAGLQQIFEKIGKDIEWGTENTSLVVAEESSIPVINRAFSNTKVDIYRLEVNEPSLEEIFRNLGSSQRGA